jgi:hypothetical protein
MRRRHIIIKTEIAEAFRDRYNYQPLRVLGLSIFVGPWFDRLTENLDSLLAAGHGRL